MTPTARTFIDSNGLSVASIKEEPPAHSNPGQPSQIGDKFKNYRRGCVCNASDFNRKLSAERRQRLPYVDPQTGIAQADCLLWRNERDRLEATSPALAQAAGAKIYRYPARPWQKKRREYLIKNEQYPSTLEHKHELHSPHFAGGREPAAYSQSIRADGQQLDPMEQLEHSQEPAGYADGTTKPSPHQSQHSAGAAFHLSLPSHLAHPPRSSSVGSYSCVDSDSRDQSSATSQSIDSPHRSHLDQEDQLYHQAGGHNGRPFSQNGVTPEHSSGLDSSSCKELLNGNAEGLPNVKHQLDQQRLPAREATQDNRLKMKRGRRGNKLTEQKPSINGHSTSAVTTVTIRRQAAELICDDDQPKATIVSGSRPYVCAICDQSYKTRPGLSYHFIHVHDSVLPKKLLDRRKMDDNQATKGPVLSCRNEPLARDEEGENKRTVQVKTKLKGATSRQALRTSRRIRGAQVVENDCLEQLKGDDKLKELKLGDDDEIDCSRDCSEKTHDCASSNQAEAAQCEEAVKPAIEREANGHDDDDDADDDDDGDDTSRAGSDRTVIESASSSDGRAAPSSPSEPAKMPRPNQQTNDGKLGPNGSDTDGLRHNIFCDFCLGTAERNRRTRLPEELISCSSCGSSGHPSCLQFSDENLRSVKNYKWQCIDCKTCTHCNTADNEAQLLICNDCDRSYHTYCLKPPLNELPEESWSCNLCASKRDRV